MAGTETDPRPERHRRGSAVSTGLLLILLALLAFLLFREFRGSFALHDPNAKPREITPRGDLAADEQSTIEIFRAASPSVVHITSLVQRQLRLNVLEIPRGTGSGFLWDAEGHVVTNYHVIQDADAAQVTLSDNTTWPARYVGAEPDKDVAVLKIDAPKHVLTPLPIGTSADLQVGQKVFAIGNPFGLDQTLTTGIISGVGREIQSVTKRPITGVIQTDAAINPGNSGGPLLDSAGRLIGVNTAIYSPSGAYAGIGFAVPVDIVNRVVPQLIRHGTVEHAGLGVSILDDAAARQLGVERGVLIFKVPEDSAAGKAGLHPTTIDDQGQIDMGDVIVAVNGREVTNSNDLFNALDGMTVGEEVMLTVSRDGKEEPVKVTLQAIPSAFSP